MPIHNLRKGHIYVLGFRRHTFDHNISIPNFWLQDNFAGQLNRATTTELTLGVTLVSPYRTNEIWYTSSSTAVERGIIAHSLARLISSRNREHVEHLGEGEQFGDQEQFKWAQ
jgi:hypothetical protein